MQVGGRTRKSSSSRVQQRHSSQSLFGEGCPDNQSADIATSPASPSTTSYGGRRVRAAVDGSGANAYLYMLATGLGFCRRSWQTSLSCSETA